MRPLIVGSPWLLGLLVACRADSTMDKRGHEPGDGGDPLPEETGEPSPIADDPLFPQDRVMEVELTLDPADWDTLRNTSRDIFEMLKGDCLAQPFDSPYEYYPASLTVDGERFEEVELRKKGLMGSQSTTKPGLKVKLDGRVEGQSFRGRDKLTLNNTPQDPTMMRTCLAYQVFRDAGVAAPLCSFVHVTVNDEDLGIYANVETVDERFLDRATGDHAGELFEGTLSDLRGGWIGTFDEETDTSDQAHLEPIVEALSLGEGERMEALAQVVDLDQWMTYWAVEVLTGHWDSYDSNRNNFYVYLRPSDGRLTFIPWGPDATFDSSAPFGDGQPQWIVANAWMPYRVASTEAGLEAYRDRLQAVASSSWDAEALQAEVDRMAGVLDPFLGEERGWKRSLTAMKSVIAGRLADVSREWDDRSPSLTEPGASTCLSLVGTVEGTFSTTWGSYPDRDLFTYGESDVVLDYLDVTYPLAEGSAVVGDAGGGVAVLMLTGSLDDGTIVAPYVQLATSQVQPGVVPLDWSPATAALYTISPGAGEFVFAAYLDGSLTFDSADTSVGGAVTGRVDAGVWGFAGD